MKRFLTPNLKTFVFNKQYENNILLKTLNNMHLHLITFKWHTQSSSLINIDHFRKEVT